MPKLVSELAQGKSYSRSSDGGQLADQATRTWKILLNYPNEPFIVPDVVGVNIGDPLSETELLPCVSLDVKADGDSRLVRIVTATYRTTPGIGVVDDGGGGSTGNESRDPKLDPPTIRPAMFSISGSLEEIAVNDYYDGTSNSTKKDAKNPNGELYDGLSALSPIYTINIDQFDTSPAAHLDNIGDINSEPFTFSGITIGARQCMLRNIECVPVVETWGSVIFRGFKRTYQFAVTRRPGGWVTRVPQTGFMVLQAGLGNAEVDSDALALERFAGRVLTNLPTPTGKDYVAATQGTRMRAMVKIPFDDGGFTQCPSAQPVALNNDGTPRNVKDYDVIMKSFRTQQQIDFGDDFSYFGIRWVY